MMRAHKIRIFPNAEQEVCGPDVRPTSQGVADGDEAGNFNLTVCSQRAEVNKKWSGFTKPKPQTKYKIITRLYDPKTKTSTIQECYIDTSIPDCSSYCHSESDNSSCDSSSSD